MDTHLCPTCHQPLPAAAPQGLCPACLMQASMHSGSQAVSLPDEHEFSKLAEAFPQLVIDELIGTGGMGRVYRAQQPHLNRTVALKVLTPERANDPEWLERFNREARALARLSHPHIVQVYDFGEAPMPYLLMEYVDGVNLRQAMQNGALTAREALAIVPKLCDALHYAHEHGVLHRDIKPENILIDTEGRVKLVDFGLAKLRDEHSLPFTLTQSGARLGTLAYMAPEQIEKPADVDHRADIYSLGVVFYEMLTGELPLGRFPAPSEASGVDPRLDGVVMRTLEKRREKRFNDAGEMKSDIENAASDALSAIELPRWDDIGYEYRSRASLGSWPLLHIAFNKDPQTCRMKRARGIIAIGMHAQGVIAMGLIAQGIFAWGVLSVGLLAMGVVCLGGLASGVLGIGLLAAHGVCAVAPVALGVSALGYISAGVAAMGTYVAGEKGAIDPLAAEISDHWMFLVMHWSNVLNALLLSLMMLIGAFGAWQAGRQRAQVLLFLALSLIGPFNYFTTSADTRPPQSFAERRQKQQIAKRRAAVIADEEARQAREARIRKMHVEWVQEASRTDSIEARDQAFQHMLEVIQSEDPEKVNAGLIAIMWSPDAQVDFGRFREPVRNLLSHPDPATRSRAINALFRCSPDASDEKRILSMVPKADPKTLEALAGALSSFSKSDFTGRYAEPMLALLKQGMEIKKSETPEAGNTFDERNVLNRLWGAKWSPAIEALVLEWSHLVKGEDGKLKLSTKPLDHNYNAFYYALSVQANKSAASVKRIFELANSSDITNVAGRCLWGLKGTVASPADYPLVTESLIKLLDNRNDEGLWQQGLGLIEMYASPAHIPALEALEKRDAMPQERSQALGKVIASVKQKSS